MCTAVRFNDRFFGRTFDFESSFGEEMVITPRGRMRVGQAENRYAFMGVGLKNEGTPLYFDGVNEWGLVACALNFPYFATYHDDAYAKAAVSASHLISLMLGFSHSVAEVREMLKNIAITNESPNKKYKVTPLHWIVSDPRESLVVESVQGGLRVYDNPVGVLTNSPELPYHLTRLADYSSLSTRNPKNTQGLLYSRGMGAIGLPGDFSSSSRFIRASFLKQNCPINPDSTTGGLGQAFDILASVSLPYGAVITDEGLPMHTRYTAVIDMESPAYYLTTSTCRAISRIKLTDSLCEAAEITTAPIYKEQIICDL